MKIMNWRSRLGAAAVGQALNGWQLGAQEVEAMKGDTMSWKFAMGSLMGALLLAAASAHAQSLSDYTAVPASVSDTVAPNVLIMLDNSGSMQNMAYNAVDFDVATVFSGIFDHTECYKINSNTFERNPAANPSTPAVCPDSNYPWSGNLLNYATMRRTDIAYWALIGGGCESGGRDSLGRCTTTAKAAPADRDKYVSTPKSSVTGKKVMPQVLLDNLGPDPTVYFLNPGESTALQGYFCVDNDSKFPGGGDTNCKDGDSYDEGAIQDKYRIALYLDKPTAGEPASGVIHDVGDKARLGLMVYDDPSPAEGGVLIADIGSTPAALTSAIEAAGIANSWTPLAETLYTAARYFAQLPVPSKYQPSAYPVAQAKDPYYFTAPRWAASDTYVTCCKSYVIVFTDGESTKDKEIPADLEDYAHVIHGSHCDAPCAGHNKKYSDGGEHFLDDVAYWAHINDLRQATVPVINEAGKDLEGIQTLTIYTFFAFGKGSELLQSAAKAGGFEDLNGNNKPDLTDEWDRINNATGEAGSDGIPDTYFESENASLLKDRLLATISSILQRSGSGSAASVLASSSTGEGAVYQAYFYPSTLENLKEVKWTGHTHGLFLDAFGNLREDSNGDGRLVYEDDKIVRMTFDEQTKQVMVQRFDDVSPADGVADSATPTGGSVELRNVKGIWEAGKELALTKANKRKIKTWIDRNNDGIVAANEWIDFDIPKKNDLAPYLRAGAAPYDAQNIINFIRGEAVTGLRYRTLTVNSNPEVWKLGDPVHSQPVVVAAPAQRYDIIYGDSSYTAFFSKYQNRRQVAYVGANDGMLHAFNAGFYHRGDDPATTTKVEHGWFTTTAPGVTNTPALGTELFGFIPQELLPHLKWLTQPDYTHVYYVDLTPKVTDARIFTPDADHPNGWGTILMGGFRLGGSCGNCPAGHGKPMTVTANFGSGVETRTFYSAYFVLDVTNPESTDYPKLLWSFSTADLGFSTTTPSMLRVSPAGQAITDPANAKWYLVVGSGPTGYDGRITQQGKLYAIDLAVGPETGVTKDNNKVTTLTADTLNAFLADPVTIDRDFDYRVEVAYMGSVIDDGTAPWRGKLYRLTMNTCTVTPCDTNVWGIADGSGRQVTELLDTFNPTSPIELGPVTNAPAVTVDDSNKLWVFAGTGRYFDNIDKSNTDTQYFVGVKDKVLFDQCSESTRTNCDSDDLVNVSTAQVCVMGTGNCGGSTDQVTGVSGASDFPSLISLVASSDGWYTALPGSGERALSRPVAIAGLVLFPTYVPTSGTCGSSGESYLYALYYLTGSAYSSPVVGTETSGGDTYVKRSTSVGTGQASQAVVHIGESAKGGGATVYIQKSTAETTAIAIQTPDGGQLRSRFLTWHYWLS